LPIFGFVASRPGTNFRKWCAWAGIVTVRARIANLGIK
jgi:hypothetical protein